MTKTKRELDREITEYLATNPPGTAAEIRRSVAEYRATSGRRTAPRQRGAASANDITGALALEMPRWAFIAHWLVTLTKSKKNRGPLDMRVVLDANGRYRVLHGAAKTVVYETRDPDMLVEYVRRTELGTQTRAADAFREEAFTRAA